jgi:hypothetical protein
MLFALRHEREGRTHVSQLLQTLGGEKKNEVRLTLQRMQSPSLT